MTLIIVFRGNIISHKVLRESDLFCVPYTVKIFYMRHQKARRRKKHHCQDLLCLTGAGNIINILWFSMRQSYFCIGENTSEQLLAQIKKPGLGKLTPQPSMSKNTGPKNIYYRNKQHKLATEKILWGKALEHCMLKKLTQLITSSPKWIMFRLKRFD